MGLLSWLFPRPRTRAAMPRQANVRARLDAAQTTPSNREHWKNTDSLSADSAYSPDVRKKLRERSRYEVANNSYARGIALTLSNDVVGTGPRLQLLTGDNEANRRIERQWERWAREVRLPEILRTMRTAVTQDGEAFIVLVTRPTLRHPVKLFPRLLECDQVGTPDLAAITVKGGRNWVDGIELDDTGCPVAYHIRKAHPGDLRQMGSLTYDRIAAEYVLHLFRPDRPGEHRGIPQITPALDLFAQLRRYTLSVLEASETAANMAAMVKTTMPSVEPAIVDEWDEIAIQRNAMLTLPEGWDVSQLRAEQPTTSYPQFKAEILNEIARCLNMPFNVAACNSSSYNYSSGRLDHQVYRKSNRIDQSQIETVVLGPMLWEWLREAALIPGYLPEALATAEGLVDHQWFWPGYEHIDPTKDSRAQTERLANNTTTLADECALEGRDWETVLRQRAVELRLMAELGLSTERQPATPTVTPDEEEDDDVTATSTNT